MKWCLKKAQREILECEKKGLRKKHRGLLKTKPNISEAKKHILKARHNFRVVIILEKEDIFDWSVNAVFYTIYHCFLAIAFRFGYESRNQSCTISLIQCLIEKGMIDLDMKFVNLLKYNEKENSIIDMREEYTYGIEIDIADNKIMKELIQDCREVIDMAMRIVHD